MESTIHHWLKNTSAGVVLQNVQKHIGLDFHFRKTGGRERPKYNMYEEEIAWLQCNTEDLWIFDKLILSRKLGYVCGPVGLDVPRPDRYIIRPVMNLLGMGREAEITFIKQSTDMYPAGHFWCEVFKGRHLSVDYELGKQVLCVEGLRNDSDPLYRWARWQKVDIEVPYPNILRNDLPYVNCEFIDGKLIEVHLRHNPDWLHNSDWLIPVWEGDNTDPPKGMKFIRDPDFKRLGFLAPE